MSNLLPMGHRYGTGRFGVLFMIWAGCLWVWGVPSPLVAYTQANLQTASDGTIEAIPLEAAVQPNPPQIRIKSYAAGTFSIFRKAPSANDWGTPVATGISLGVEGIWTDSGVSAGVLYEYKFVNTAGLAHNSLFPTGYILCGIEVDQTQPKGRMAVVVASDVLANIPAEYSRYKADLVADGWMVHEIPCPRAADYSGLGHGALATVKIDSGGTGYANNDVVFLSNAGGKKAGAKLTVDAGGMITSATIVPGGGGAGFSAGEQLTMSGETTTGTGAKLIGHINTSQLTLVQAELVVGGSGYTSGEVVTLTGQTSGKTAQGTIIADEAGMIFFFNNIAGQSGFILGETLLMSGNSTGSGVGAMTVGDTDAGGALQQVDFHGSGSGYLDGDTATLTGNTSGKNAQVTLNVDANGVITSVDITSSEAGFLAGEMLALSGAGSGTGVGPFRAGVAGPLQSIQVVSGGSGYVDGDTVGIRYGATDAQGILSVTGGSITSVTITDGGGGFNEGYYLFLSGLEVTASGVGLSVLAVDNSNVGRAVVVLDGGSGYLDNDQATITGNSSGLTATGSLVAPGGVIAAVSTVLPGTFTPGESLTITPASGGGGAVATAGASMDNHLLIRAAIQTVNNTHPGELKNVVMIGKVPVCRSGISDGVAADGHGNAAPYGADAFYADMDGAVGTDWIDSLDLLPGNLAANFAGDSQFDALKISEVGNGIVELGFSRIDLSLGIPNEMAAMGMYFDKLHRYKVASPDFHAGLRVCDRLGFPNVREAGLQSMSGVVGMNNMEYIGAANLPPVTAGQDADQLYSAQHGPYLFYFKGDGEPGGGEGGRAVFWTGMQSHWGYWYEQGLVTSGANAMQKRLAEDSFTLSFTWNVWGLRYLYHRMGMGLDAGDMMKQSINNQGWQSGPYTYKFNNQNNGDFHGSLYMNHMGDPALRLFMFEPPSGLSATMMGDHPVLSWTASPNLQVTGYHVYRAANAHAPYTRLTSVPQAGTTYSDTSVTTGSYSYMVRAIRLETTGGGTFYNASLGITAALDATPSGMDAWRMTYFGTTDTDGDRADAANPAKDGLSNLVKYALGLNPHTSYSLESAGLVFEVPPVDGGNFLKYSFTGTASDVTYIVEAVSDLTGTWTTLYTHSGSAPGSVTVQDNQEVTAGIKRFMRLRVSRP